MSDLPVACTLDPAALETRRQGLLATLRRQARRCDELPSGYRLSFEATGETLMLIHQTVEAERHCCRFLQFQITVGPADADVSLELTGPTGTREFLSALFEP